MFAFAACAKRAHLRVSGVSMKRLPLAFFTTAALSALVGMGWSMVMTKSNDFTMAPAHAHLNLLGWATLAIMGGFYALAGERVPRAIGWINFALSSVAMVVSIPALARLPGGDKSANPMVAGGSGLAFAGIAAFFIAVVVSWRTPKSA
jgi:hypothetical protein